MSDEPREETQPETEEVEAHSFANPIGDPIGEKYEDDGDDVEAHGPIGPMPLGEPPIGP